MKYFAAFTEYGGILPATIRRTEEDAMQALKYEPGIVSEKPFDGGVCLGSFEDLSGTMFSFSLPKMDEITWLHGWRHINLNSNERIIPCD